MPINCSCDPRSSEAAGIEAGASVGLQPAACALHHASLPPVASGPLAAPSCDEPWDESRPSDIRLLSAGRLIALVPRPGRAVDQHVTDAQRISAVYFVSI